MSNNFISFLEKAGYTEQLKEIPNIERFFNPNFFDDEIAGDINGDGILNILDIVSLVNLVLASDYEVAGDINLDGILNILDIVSLVNLILSNNN